MEPWSSRFSRTRCETRSLTQETPFQVHGFVPVFHAVSFLDGSEAVLKATRASKSGF